METHRCVIKYIDLNKSDGQARLHNPDEFEMHQVQVEHRNYDELHSAVFGQCPDDFRCIEPIALRHEVLWSLGL